MNNKKISKRFISKVLLILIILNSFATGVLATDMKQATVTSKPLVVMMEFKDYKFSDIDEKEEKKEKENRVRGIKGEDFTREYVNNWLFAEDTYTSVDKSGVEREIISTRQFFKQMTGGTYDFKGSVVGPYTAKHNAKYYGANDQDSAVYLVEEAIEAVSKDPNIDLSEFDVETRVRDINTSETHITYNKPDGQVDTVIVIHPGIGGEWGGGSLNEGGKGAIYPFRRGFTWYGDSWGLKEYETKDTSGKNWRFDDFLIVAQDAASDMVIHEFGHILGLPDLYSYDGFHEPIKYWDVMGASYTGRHIPGDGPIAYGGYSRYYLQKAFEDGNASDVKWANILEYDIDDINGQEIDLNRSTDRKDGEVDLIKINLPKISEKTIWPKEGHTMFFTGTEANANNSMTIKNIDLREYLDASLTFYTWYNLIDDVDFAGIRVREVGTEEWKSLKGSTTKQYGDEHLITGWEDTRWQYPVFDLSDYIGKKIDVKFIFRTGSYKSYAGMYFDDIKITGQKIGKAIEEDTELEDENDGIIYSEIARDFVVGEQTYHEFELKNDEKVNIRLDYRGSSDLTWVIYDEYDRAIAYPLDSNLEFSEGEFDLPKGKHKITVYGPGNPRPGKFDLTVKKTNEGTIDDKEEYVETYLETVLDLNSANVEGKDIEFNGIEAIDIRVFYDRYYIVEWRKGELGKADGGHEHLKPNMGVMYEPGMLIWYVDEIYRDGWGNPDQEAWKHKGNVFAGVVDADQTPIRYNKKGEEFLDKRADFMMHDASFGLKPERDLIYDWGGGETISYDNNVLMVPDFDDSRDYSNKEGNNIEAGLDLLKLGLKIMVLEEKGDRTGGKIKLINTNNPAIPKESESSLKLDASKLQLIDNKEIVLDANNDGSVDRLGKEAYVSYKHKVSKKEIVTKLTLDGGQYKGKLGEVEAGEYEINYIILEDNIGNAKAIYNSNLHSGHGLDLSDFNIAIK